MWHGVRAGLFAFSMLACTSQSAPTSTQQPTPSASPTASPTTGPTHPGPTPSQAQTTPSPARSPTPADATYWVARPDVAPGPSAREDHTWTVDSDGHVAYLFGGRSNDGPQADLWAFDLITETWTERRPSGTGPAPRFGHTATWVPDVGLVVWSGQGADFFDDIWAYDPTVDAWHQLPALGAVPEARYGSCASLGPDGRLWISHGFTADDGRFADTRAYDFATGEWQDMTPAGDLPVKRCLHDCAWAPNDRLILYGGQTTGVSALGDIWAYDPERQAWQRGPDNAEPPRQLYGLAMGKYRALVFGGGAVDGSYLADTLVVTPDSLEVHADPFPSPDGPAARSGATLINTGDSFLLFGGQNEDGLLADLWEYSGYWISLF